MAFRAIEIIAPRLDKDEVTRTLEEQAGDKGCVYWSSPLEDGDTISFRVVLDVLETENILDKLEQQFDWTEKYRIVVYPVEATIPRLDPLTKEEKGEQEPFNMEDQQTKNRISREELYSDVLDMTLLSKYYVLLVACSSLVAVIGLMRDNVAIIIGAMVLAPLLGPNVGFALATTLGDKRLGLESLKTLFIGIITCFALSAMAGLLLGMSDPSHELITRSVTSYSDIILAIVSGVAGIITVTLGVATSLVGVMVALSLLPPLTASGLFFGAGMLPEAVGAALLFLVNVICLNLAGVVTFLFQGVRPLSWWEQKKAKVATIRAAIIWTVLLATLMGLMALEIR